VCSIGVKLWLLLHPMERLTWDLKTNIEKTFHHTQLVLLFGRVTFELVRFLYLSMGDKDHIQNVICLTLFHPCNVGIASIKWNDYILILFV